MATCSSADSVLDAASQIKSNATKLDTFVNGTASQTVQLGTGNPTPTLRKFIADAQDVASLAASEANTAIRQDFFLAYYGKEVLINPGFVRTNGTIYVREDPTDYYWKYSNLLPVDFYSITVNLSKVSAGISYVAFYDADGVFISGLSEIDANTNATISVPFGAVKMRLTGYTDDNSSFIASSKIKNSVSKLVTIFSHSDSLNINKGKDFPLKPMTRNGIISDRSTAMNNAILDVKVLNAKPDTYYRIGYFQNGYPLQNSEYLYNWMFTACNTDTFSSNSVESEIIALRTGGQPQINRSLGVQTLVFNVNDIAPSQNYKDLVFIVTIDASELPADGTYIPLNQQTGEAWSWIIDPSCYFISSNESNPDSLTINQGAIYPLKEMNRGGITSAPPPDSVCNFLLDIKVTGASHSYFYGLKYIRNGAVINGVASDGFIISKHAISSYATDGSGTNVVYYTDECPDIPRDGKIHTIHIESFVESGLNFYITIDTSKLPNYGTQINMYSETTSPAWSYIISPTCYYYKESVEVESSSPLVYSCSANGTLQVSWQSRDSLYRLNFGPNGNNSLPNIIGIDRADYVSHRSDAVWETVNTGNTDWLPPMAFSAVNNGDGHELIYTGGNHTEDDTNEGDKTARNILYKIYCDGQEIPIGGTLSGSAKTISILISNEIYASNTISLERYALRQSFLVDIHAGGVEVVCEVFPYEDIVVRTDNGPQMVTLGFRGTMLYIDGENTARASFNSNSNSGQSGSYPNAWAVVLQGTGGQQVSWMDRSFGIGDGRYVESTAPLVRGGGETNQKFYHAAIKSSASFSAGQSYRWRGGYSWQEVSPQPSALIDSVFTFWKNGKMHQAVIKTPSEYTVLPD